MAFQKQVIAAAALAASAACAQQTPPPLVKDLLDAHRNHGGMVVQEKLTPEQREFFTRDFEARAGYKAKRTQPNELNAVSELRARAVDKPLPAGIRVPRGLRYVGTFDENATQKDLFFEGTDGTVMLTLFDFAQQGATIILFPELQNARVGNAPATLTLAWVPGRSAAVWVLTWVLPEGRVQAQLRAPERVDSNGVPAQRPESIVALAQAFRGEP